MIRRRVLAAMTLVAALLLAGCTSSDSLAQQYRDGSEKGYIAGDFQIVEIPDADRGEPVVFEGVTETGETVSSDDYRGGVLVVNFWYAACGPCIVEAPMLEEVWQEYQDQGVAFLGVNTYDQPATALSFARDNNVTYPSVIDVNDGRVKLAFAQVTPIQATPTTLVIDQEGRVAARIIGQLASASILSTLVAAPFSILIFNFTNLYVVIAGILLWGVGMGAQESVFKAAVTSIVPKETRSSGFGISQTAFGICWFLGSWALGWLYDQNLNAMVLASTVTQLLSLPCFYLAAQKFTGTSSQK